MNNQANSYVFRVLSQRIIGILTFFVFSRWAYSVRSITYFAMYLVFAVVSLALLNGVSRRVHLPRAKNLPRMRPYGTGRFWRLYWVLAYFAVYFLAGLESSGAPAETRLGVRGRYCAVFRFIFPYVVGGSREPVSGGPYPISTGTAVQTSVIAALTVSYATLPMPRS